MSKDFKVYQEGNKQIIERLTYPRFKAVITFNSSLSDLGDIELTDKTTNPLKIAKAMREAGQFLFDYKTKEKL